MFKVQIEQLLTMQEELEVFIEQYEAQIKKKKEELRDIRAGLASLERIQAKYEDKEQDETVGLSI